MKSNVKFLVLISSFLLVASIFADSNENKDNSSKVDKENQTKESSDNSNDRSISWSDALDQATKYPMDANPRDPLPSDK
jgi:hypothetical protein